jgi:hypothetical protein
MPASHGGYQNYRGKALSFLAESGVAILKVDDFRHRWIRVTIQAAGRIRYLHNRSACASPRADDDSL